MEYTKREEAILSGIIELICSGMDVYSMKVSDIAKAAGMGKGTVYEYFSSKEEMITKALILGVRKSLEGVEQAVAQATGFEQKYRILIAEVSRLMENGLPAVKIFFSGADIENTYEKLKGGEDFLKNIAVMEAIINEVLCAGAAEGEISAVTDEFYAQMAVFSSVLGYCAILQNAPEQYGAIAADNSFRLLVNALR